MQGGSFLLIETVAWYIKHKTQEKCFDMLNSIKICFHDYQHTERLSNLFVNIKVDYTSTSGRIQRYQEIQEQR